jgi:MATE family multidrug resistance protein
MSSHVGSLTRFSPGSLRELLVLLFPILLMSFSGSFLGFIERIFVSWHSIEALEASLSVTYIMRMFQISTMSIASMAQVFVGYYNGGQEYSKIGQCVWQMIWFSILSMLFTIPLSVGAAKFFIQGTEIDSLGYPYFLLLSSVNFLFPLGSALSCFFLGRGKTKFILFATILFCILNLILDRIFILGFPPFFSGIGLIGAGISTLIAQGLLCLTLLIVFLQNPNRERFGTLNWAFKPSLFWHYIQPGILRGIGRIILLVTWTLTAHLMTSKGGDYLLVLSIGGTVSLFLAFLGDGLCQAMVTTLSNLMGAGQKGYLKKALGSGFIFLLLVGIILSFPLLFYPDYTLTLLIKDTSAKINEDPLRLTLAWVWLQTISYMLMSILLSIILVHKDTFFLFMMGCINWLLLLLPVYFALNKYGSSPDKFWLINTLGAFIASGIYFLRIRQKKWISLWSDKCLFQKSV